MNEIKWMGCGAEFQTGRGTAYLYRPARQWLAALLGLSFLGAAVAYGAVVQEFYMPMPETQVYTVFNKQALYDPPEVDMESVFSIIVTTPDTLVVYDQWEDGYEADINNPTNSSTAVWGDGNDANGICPGFANDPSGVPGGTVITLRNPGGFPIPRNPVDIYYDGGDRVGASRAITVSRGCYEVYQRGAAQATLVEVLSTLDHGASYIAPVGTNVSANGMFTYVDLMVMADRDNTTVAVDPDGSGPMPAFTTNINRGVTVTGGAFLVQNTSKGATVKADNPIQVHMITGKRFSGQFETRSFVLRPVEIWSSKYIIPIGTINSNYPGLIYLFNTNAAPLTVNRTDRTGSGTLNVPGNNGLLAYTLPLDSGTLLESADGTPFFALCTMNADLTGYSGADFDWGFAPIPFEGLTTEAVCGWGTGAQTNSESWTGTENGSPVWITALSNTTLYVDYNGDGTDDFTTNVSALASTRLYDSLDNDQTGMRIRTTDGTLIAGAWGEDASVASAGPPFLDLGYALVPFPVISITKTSILVPELDTAPANVLNVGDVVEYTLRVSNKGLLPLGNLLVFDGLAVQLQYLTNSTKLDGVMVPDDAFGTGTSFPLDEDPAGYRVPVVPRQSDVVFVYRCRIREPGLIVNFGAAGDPGPSQVVATNDVFSYTTVSIGDASVIEGNSGTTDLVFTVTLANASTEAVTMDFSTSNGTATAGIDYVAVTGTLTISAGDKTGQIIVNVNGDTLVEPDETLFVTLSNVSTNGIILDGQATGTILNDDISINPVTWTYNPRRDSWYGTLAISNDTAISFQSTSVWYEVKSNSAHRLRFPTGADTNTGPDWFYLDLSTQFNLSLLSAGNGDLILDPGESVVFTNIELWGRGSVTNSIPAFEDRVKIIWDIPPSLPPASPPQDTDGDGVSNSGEYVAGTNPADQLSVFKINVTPDGGNNRLSWEGRADRVYSVLYSTNLFSSKFSVLAGNIDGVEPLTVYIDTNATSRGQTFYRGEVRLK